jgi:hypothetical protein
MSIRPKWSLDPKHVGSRVIGSNGVSTSRRSRAAGGPSWARITLLHRPSGVTVEGEIPSGAFTRAQMRVKKEALEQRLFTELQAKVARHLRIPGRAS